MRQIVTTTLLGVLAACGVDTHRAAVALDASTAMSTAMPIDAGGAPDEAAANATDHDSDSAGGAAGTTTARPDPGSAGGAIDAAHDAGAPIDTGALFADAAASEQDAVRGASDATVDASDAGCDGALPDACANCARPNEGCPCEAGTIPVFCDPPEIAVDGGVLVCSEGTRYCRAERWTECEALTEYTFIASP